MPSPVFVMRCDGLVAAPAGPATRAASAFGRRSARASIARLAGVRAPRVRGTVRMMRPVLPGVMRMLRSVGLPGTRLERQQGGDVVDRLIAQIDRPVALFLGEILIGLTPLEADLQLTLQLLRVALLER